MRRLAATSLRRNVACRLVLLLSGSYEEFQHPKRVIRTVKNMTDMRRFFIDKMPPHFFYPPLFWPHTITGGAKVAPAAGHTQYYQGRNAKRRWATTLSRPHLTNSDSLCDVRIISAVECLVLCNARNWVQSLEWSVVSSLRRRVTPWDSSVRSVGPLLGERSRGIPRVLCVARESQSLCTSFL